MKSINRIHFVLLCAFVFIILPTVNASSFSIAKSVNPYSGEWKNLKASEFVALSVNGFGRLTGRRLSIKEKISFILLRKGLKHAIIKDPNLTVSQYLSAPHKTSKGWKIFIILTSIVVSFIITYLIVYALIIGV